MSYDDFMETQTPHALPLSLLESPTHAQADSRFQSNTSLHEIPTHLLPINDFISDFQKENENAINSKIYIVLSNAASIIVNGDVTMTNNSIGAVFHNNTIQGNIGDINHGTPFKVTQPHQSSDSTLKESIPQKQNHQEVNASDKRDITDKILSSTKTLGFLVLGGEVNFGRDNQITFGNDLPAISFEGREREKTEKIKPSYVSPTTSAQYNNEDRD
ncbi:hypothetical protein PVAND_011555 [Polypedilum vanderplanki]|uniref:Uncharacterized protein n=1 Tax=Polypedilum vanderplanki TaxID=319348 RepID=A0A9J6CKH4_POLVA|nr:hypothetical protein PVAND_011555 [Polypedilum vanderplanki]